MRRNSVVTRMTASSSYTLALAATAQGRMPRVRKTYSIRWIGSSSWCAITPTVTSRVGVDTFVALRTSGGSVGGHYQVPRTPQPLLQWKLSTVRSSFIQETSHQLAQAG